MRMEPPRWDQHPYKKRTGVSPFSISGPCEVSGCTLQACKPCTCPAPRPKEEPRVSDRDISGLMGGAAYVSETRSWSDTPSWAADSRQDLVAYLAPGGRGRLPVIGGVNLRLAHRLPGKLAGGHATHRPFDKLLWWRCSDLKSRHAFIRYNINKIFLEFILIFPTQIQNYTFLFNLIDLQCLFLFAYTKNVNSQ